LAARGAGRAYGFGCGDRRRLEDVGNAMCVDRDQANGTLGLDRAQPLADMRLGRAEARLVAQVDRDEIAVLRLGSSALRDQRLAALRLLVDRDQAARPIRKGAEDA